MTRELATCVLASLVFLGGLNFAHATTIRVRIANSASELSVSGMNLRFKGASETFRAGSAIRPAAISSPMSSLILKPELAGGFVRWTVIDKTTGTIVRRMTGGILNINGEMMRLGLKAAPSELTVRAAFEGIRPRVDVIASLDLEDYLKGVLPHEMPAEWPREALKAQAVASRTYALTKIRQRAKRLYHVESTVMDQVYNWLMPTETETAKQAAVRQALEETRGEVLSDGQGHMLTAYFHADCGGKTEEAQDVWGPHERKSGIAVDAGCPFSPKAKWNWSVSSSEIYSKIRGSLKLPWTGFIKDLAIQGLTASGRVAQIAVVTSEGLSHIISGAEFRSLVGFDRLRSTNFQIVRKENGQFEFAGRGHGHGVGLCQWGARKLAATGTNYRDILKHYYPQATLSTVE